VRWEIARRDVLSPDILCSDTARPDILRSDTARPDILRYYDLARADISGAVRAAVRSPARFGTVPAPQAPA
jgi:hypothetical protein